MPHGDKRTPEARTETDSSLRVERAKTDEELARRRAELEGDADAVVRTARDRADTVLHDARGREDTNTPGSVSDRVMHERLREDAALAEARELADATLEAERVQYQVALAGLLATERHETDSRLLRERKQVDEVLT